MVACIALVIVSLIFLDLRKNGKPFSKAIILKMRILSVLIMIGAFLPNIFAGLSTLSNGNTMVIGLNPKTLLIAMLGVIIGILSEVFVYGYELQDDMDLIA